MVDVSNVCDFETQALVVDVFHIIGTQALVKGTFFSSSEQVVFFNGPVIGIDITKVTDITTYTWGLVSGIPEIGTIFSIM